VAEKGGLLSFVGARANGEVAPKPAVRRDRTLAWPVADQGEAGRSNERGIP